MKTGKLAEVFVFSNFTRVPVEEVVAGDICAVTGLSDVSIGETICNTNDVIPLPSISVSLLAAECKSLCQSFFSCPYCLWTGQASFAHFEKYASAEYRGCPHESTHLA